MCMHSMHVSRYIFSILSIFIRFMRCDVSIICGVCVLCVRCTNADLSLKTIKLYFLLNHYERFSARKAHNILFETADIG